MESATRTTIVVLALITLSLGLACSLVHRQEAVATEGRLCLSATPSDAKVRVDGEYVGEAREIDKDSGCLALERGRHNVTVHKEGYLPMNREVYIGVSDLEVTVRLSPEP